MNALQHRLLWALAAMAIFSSSGCGYNYVIGLDEKVNNAWSEVDNQLKRRNDLIPQLVATVRGVAHQEQSVFLGIEEARKSFFQAQSVEQKQAAGRQMDGALSRLLLLQETYPELKSSEHFRDLLVSLEGTENRLTVARNRYNEAVEELNVYSRQLPGSLWSSVAGVKKREYYKVDEADKKTPTVDFSDLDPKKSGEPAEKQMKVEADSPSDREEKK